MITVKDMTSEELAALLHFHAEAGVEWLLEDEAVDRIAEFDLQKAARQAQRASAPPSATARTPAAAQPAFRSPQRSPAVAVDKTQRAPPAIPNERAVEDARFAAESARSLAELKTALEAFNGCNLRMTARSTIFAEGSMDSGLMIIGPAPNADDDREGMAFSGRNGQMLERMLAAVGLSREGVTLTHAIPWRPPGDRAAWATEIEICRPFIERQIALAEPKLVLLLGNAAMRFFYPGNDALTSVRGSWREIGVAGHSMPAMASFHPQDLITVPMNKKLAWADWLQLGKRLA